MERFSLSLDGKWRLSGRSEPADAVPQPHFDQAEFLTEATVPGNLELELFRAGRTGDPFFAMNARQYRPYEFYEWLFEREFEYDGIPRDLLLNFDGLDCFGTIWINGKLAGTCENALIPHSFPVGPLLRNGTNRIAVHIASANNRFRRYPMRAEMFSSFPFNYEASRIRKPAHVWGWDITPRLALGGIFRHVHLEERCANRLDEGFLQTVGLEPGRAQLRYCYKLTIANPAVEGLRLILDGECGNSHWHAESAVWSAQGIVPITVEHPRLWYPRHYGEPALYDVTVRFRCGEGKPLFEEHFHFGIRTVQLRMKPMAPPSPEPDFQFLINDVPVRVFGTNHVPADALHSRDPERFQTIFDLADQLGCNLLRIWGGNLYEPQEFYDECDRRGLMVWQDFMMGCALYPNDETFCQVIREEAECAIRMLRQHPSLVLWAGDNECDCVPAWGGLERNPNLNRLTREVLPAVCRENDPFRPYLASSPYYSPEAIAGAVAAGADTAQLHKLAPEQHLWGPRDYFKSDFYRNTQASFLSETGYHGSPNASSIRRFLPENALWPPQGNPQWYYHASNPFLPDSDAFNFRVDIMSRQIEEFFGFQPEDLETFAAASQLCQAEALKYLIELFRSNPKRSGLIWWNLIDCWPQFSDSVVDYYGKCKLAFHFIRRLQEEVAVIVCEPNAWKRRIVAANDSRRPRSGKCRIIEFRSARTIFSTEFQLEPGTVGELGELEGSSTAQELWLLEWKLEDGTRGVDHAVTGYPRFDYSRFCREWLPAIAALDDSFNPAQLGK